MINTPPWMWQKLSRALNLRDLGGLHAYPAGRVVRRGRLFRAATLSGLDGEMFDAVRAFGIRTIIDFRHNSERSAYPTPSEALGCNDYWCHDHTSSKADLGPWLRDPNLTAAASRDAMMTLYRELPYEQSSGLAYLFRSAISGSLPILFHCAAGKDRTGVAAALILASLGVSRTDIGIEYRLSADYDLLSSPPVRGRPPMAPSRRESVLPMLIPDLAYLDAMFSEIEARSGSLEAYFLDTLNLKSADLTTLRATMLE